MYMLEGKRFSNDRVEPFKKPRNTFIQSASWLLYIIIQTFLSPFSCKDIFPVNSNFPIVILNIVISLKKKHNLYCSNSKSNNKYYSQYK